MAIDDAHHTINLSYPSDLSVEKSGVVQERGFPGLYFLTAVAVSKTTIAPLERAKLLIQNEGGIIKTEPYKGIRNCLWRTVMEEGFGSLWRGNTANVIRYLPAQAINFAFYDWLKCQLNKNVEKDEDGFFLRSERNICAGFYAGSLSHLFVYPMDYARTRLALDTNRGGERQFKGLVDVYRTLASHGLAGLYRGFMASWVGASGYRSLYFGVFDSLKPVFLTGTMQDSFFASFTLAWLMASAAGFTTYPLDNVRRRLMMMSGEHKSSFVDVYAHIIEKEDPRILFKGGGANILRATAGAVVLATYDKLKLRP